MKLSQLLDYLSTVFVLASIAALVLTGILIMQASELARDTAMFAMGFAITAGVFLIASSRLSRKGSHEKIRGETKEKQEIRELMSQKDTGKKENIMKKIPDKKAAGANGPWISRGDVALLAGTIETVAIIQSIMSLGGLGLAMSGKDRIMLALLIAVPVLAVISSILHELSGKYEKRWIWLTAAVLDRAIVLLVPLVLAMVLL